MVHSGRRKKHDTIETRWGLARMKNPLFVLKKIKCAGCGKKQLSSVCKECRQKNIDVMEGKQETLE